MPTAPDPGAFSHAVLQIVTIWSGVTLIIGTAIFWTWGVVRWRLVPRISSTYSPTASVIIAGKDEELYIRTVLESVLQSDYPSERLEICFVDDHSDDRTSLIAQEIARQHPGRLHVVSAPEVAAGSSPKKSALAYGIRRTSGDILLFTDSDSEVHSGWVRAMVGEYDEDTGAVAGASFPIEKGTLHGRLYRIERFLTALTSASAIGYGSPASVTGQNFSFRRQAFENVGGYAHAAVASGDDDLMAQTIARKGWKVKFCSTAESVVTDLRPPNPRAHVAAATRHQSTLPFYPWSWRIAYLLTILASGTLLAGLLWSLFHAAFFMPLLMTWVLKLLLDGLGAFVFARRLHLRLTLFDFLLAETSLPIYLIIRPLLVLNSSFSWRGRLHRCTARSVPDPAS